MYGKGDAFLQRIRSSWVRLLGGGTRRTSDLPATKTGGVEEWIPAVPEDYPIFPPPPPQEILRDREGYWAVVKRRKYGASGYLRGFFTVSSLSNVRVFRP